MGLRLGGGGQSDELTRGLTLCEIKLDQQRRAMSGGVAAAAGGGGALGFPGRPTGYGGFNAPLSGQSYGYGL